jgi:hypothetical protein
MSKGNRVTAMRALRSSAADAVADDWDKEDITTGLSQREFGFGISS